MNVMVDSDTNLSWLHTTNVSFLSSSSKILLNRFNMSRKVKIGFIASLNFIDHDILKNVRSKSADTPFGKPSDDLTIGEFDGVECVFLLRRGYQRNILPGNINFQANMWALKEEGCTHVISITACGSLQENIKLDDLVILSNFIDRTTNRKQTFYDGIPNHPVGVCHLPMHPVFEERTRQLLVQAAQKIDIMVHDSGTVVVIEGPRFSTKSECAMFKQWGGDVVDMTVVPEVILAKEAGLCCAAIAITTYYNFWSDNKDELVTLSKVLHNFRKNTHKLTNLITTVIPLIANESWSETLKELQEVVHRDIVR